MPTHSRRPTPEQIADELDGLVETRDVERTIGYTRRWISELIARGRFPPPDVPGQVTGHRCDIRGGVAHPHVAQEVLRCRPGSVSFAPSRVGGRGATPPLPAA